MRKFFFVMITHDVLLKGVMGTLANHVLKAKALVFDVLQESLFADGSKCTCSQSHSDPSVLFRDEDTLHLKIRELHLFGANVRVGHLHTYEATFLREFTTASHVDLLTSFHHLRAIGRGTLPTLFESVKCFCSRI